MIVRGICSLVTGLKGYSDNIEVISIVDKFLEHSRIFVFANGGDEKYYLSSADWMYRNLDNRSEVAVPILDRELKLQLKQYLLVQLKDNTKARIVNKEQDNKFVAQSNGHRIRTHEEIPRLISGRKSVTSPQESFLPEPFSQTI
jgi:polyphosphate kinase